MSLSSRWEDDSSSLAFVDMISCSLAGGVFFPFLICLYWQRLASSNAHTNRDPPKLMANTQPHFFFRGDACRLREEFPFCFFLCTSFFLTNTHTRARVHTVGGRRRRRYCVMPPPSLFTQPRDAFLTSAFLQTFASLFHPLRVNRFSALLRVRAARSMANEENRTFRGSRHS